MIKSRNFGAITKALLAATLFGLNAPLAKLFLEEAVAPIPMAAFLYLGSGLGAGLLLLAQRGTEESGLQRADVPWLLGALLAGGVAAPIVLMFSLDVTPAATASLLLNFEGVATTLIAAWAFREAVGRRVWGAVALVTAASILISWDPGGAWGITPGALGVLLACTLWGIDNNFTRNISARNPLTIVAIKGLGAGLFSLLLALITGAPFPGLGAALAAMVLGSFSYGLSITLFILALRDLGAARTSAFFSTAPFIGSLISFAIFGTVPDPLFVVAFTVMVAGTALLAGEEHHHRHVHAPLIHAHRHRHDDAHHTHVDVLGDLPQGGWHTHEHAHEAIEHTHPHTPDLHHQHEHAE